MAVEIMSMFTRVFAQLVSWFELIIFESGFLGLYLGGFFLLLIAKFLLEPLFGSVGSDRARKKNEE